MTDASACGGINVIPGISFFTVAASSVLAIGTIILHGAILYAIIKDRKKKFKLFFYKLLFNISVADILCGLFNDPYAVAFHTLEGLHKPPINIKVFHVSLLLLGSVPLVTLVVLCFDRIRALLRPMKYRNGIQGLKSWAVIGVVWVVSIIQILAYFKMGFIPYLIVFAAVNIATTTVAMIATFVVHRQKLGRNVNMNGPNANTSEKPSKRHQKQERRATRTFLIMSVVIILSYLPTCFATGYMNSCKNCNCAIVHSLRDIAVVSILAGPFFRAINFLACLKSLRCVFLPGIKRSADLSQLSTDQQLGKAPNAMLGSTSTSL